MELKIVQGDITKLSVDAIVNAANNTLLGGGGVDGAIHNAAGSSLKKECEEIIEKYYPDGLPTGEAVITPGYNLKAKHVIHTVGPIYHELTKEEAFLLLKKAYESCLEVAEQNMLGSVAFPAISTGIYGFPKGPALAVVEDVLERFPFESVSNVILCFYGDEDYKLAKEYFDMTDMFRVLYKK